MNIKRVVLTTVLVASMVTMTMPVYAEGGVTEGVYDMVNDSVINSENNLEDDSDNNLKNHSEISSPGSSIDDSEQSSVNESIPGSSDHASEVEQTTNKTATVAWASSEVANTTSELVLLMNSNKMFHNGKQYLAPHPMVVKDGVSYVSIRAIVERTGLKLSYDSKSRETIIMRGSDELRFKLNSKTYKVNGVTKQMRGASYSSKDVFLVPLTSITQALGIPYKVNQQEKKVILTLSTKPVASFRIGNKEIFAGETMVQYIPSVYSPLGLEIVDEEWTGREDVFMYPGTYIVSYRVMDSSGQWSDTYWQTVKVSKPHEPPVANFTTDKETYKMGEMITYSDLSTDPDNSIVSRQWFNNEPAFFLPGTKKIRLTVTNKYGLSSTYEKTIQITNETLYTREEFYKLFTPVGSKYSLDGTKIPTWDKVPYQYDTEPVTLFRSNSPETVNSEGILYRDSGSGYIRFMLHHLNSTRKSAKLYVVATNQGKETARITQHYLGIGGPSRYATAAGKMSVQRFFESKRSGDKYKDVWIAPGQSKVILTDLSSVTINHGDVLSLFAELYTDHPLHFNVIMVEKSKDPIKTLPKLKLLAKDSHIRGTFYDATKNIRYGGLLGETPARLLIGDNSQDPYLVGTDRPTGAYQMNAGNFGVLYRITLHRVAPRTLITFNPRGGSYDGVIMINGEVVPLASGSNLTAPHDQAVLYRTGDFEETLEIQFTPAPGSNLAVNLLFQPLPEIKEEQ